MPAPVASAQSTSERTCGLRIQIRYPAVSRNVAVPTVWPDGNEYVDSDPGTVIVSSGGRGRATADLIATDTRVDSTIAPASSAGCHHECDSQPHSRHATTTTT